MRALVVYESMFGNTKAIAEALAAGLFVHVPGEIVEVGRPPAGCPTRWTWSSWAGPPTRSA